MSVFSSTSAISVALSSFEILDIVDGNHDIHERAKDLSHNGRNFHDKVYKTILKKIKNG